MTVFSRRLRIVGLGLFLAAYPSLAEDLTVVSKVTFGNKESIATQYVSSEYSRSTTADADTIVHFPTGKLTMVDRKKKEYWEATVEEMQEYWDKMAREMRKSGMADMFGLRDDPKVEKLKGSRTIAGYDCEHWSLEVGDALEVDMWAAPGLAPPQRYYDGRKLSSVAMGPMGQLFEKMYEELKNVKGFPLSTAIIIRTPMSRTQTEEEAQEVRKTPIPASAFQLPDGYRKVKSPFQR